MSLKEARLDSKEISSNDSKDLITCANIPIDIQKGTVETREDGIIIEDGLRRGLEGKHVTLISLASVIGASCFYGFGYALYLSGPLGALIGFGIIGEWTIYAASYETGLIGTQDSRYGL